MAAAVPLILAGISTAVQVKQARTQAKEAKKGRESIERTQAAQRADLKKKKDEESRKRRSRERVLAGAQGRSLGETITTSELGVQRVRTLGG